MKESAQLALSWLRSRSVEVDGPWFILTVDNKWLGYSFYSNLTSEGNEFWKHELVLFWHFSHRSWRILTHGILEI